MHKVYWRLLMEERTVLLVGITLSVITAFAGIALLAVSGWFIRAAALAGLTAAPPGATVSGWPIMKPPSG